MRGGNTPAVMTYTLRVITYQSFGLDKKESRSKDLLFFLWLPLLDSNQQKILAQKIAKSEVLISKPFAVTRNFRSVGGAPAQNFDRCSRTPPPSSAPGSGGGIRPPTALAGNRRGNAEINRRVVGSAKRKRQKNTTHLGGVFMWLPLLDSNQRPCG